MQVSTRFAALVSVAILVLVGLVYVLIASQPFFTATNISEVKLTETQQAVLMVLPTFGGTTQPSAGRYFYPTNTNITLNATALSTHHFDRWIISTHQIVFTQKTNQLTIVPQENTTYRIQATFKENNQ